MMQTQINLVKVFSSTKMKDREALGDKVTDWLTAHPDLQIVKTDVVQSSDAEFHCFSIVLFCSAA